MENACDERGKRLRNAIPNLAGEERRVAKCLEVVTRRFVDMQQQRHTADYNSERRWARTETLYSIASVHVAFSNWKAIRESPGAKDFLLSLFVRRR
jgi:hypothetical protein